MATPFRFDRAWSFAVTPDELWSTLEQTDRYTAWWPWLRDLELDGTGPGLRTGAIAHLVIQAPLPYQLRCTISVDDARRPHTLTTHVSGDLHGPATLQLEATDAGTDARMCWSLEVQSPLLRPLATVARPALAWAHDRVVERGLDQFEARALQARRVE
ncbi:MAG TPA: SRPBCC family protein [Acidimicrobiia bacterium]|nr:SRPBCC family protein [Acidimicrobiia bacterium]